MTTVTTVKLALGTRHGDILIAEKDLPVSNGDLRYLGISRRKLDSCVVEARRAIQERDDKPTETPDGQAPGGEFVPLFDEDLNRQWWFMMWKYVEPDLIEA